MIQSQRIGRAVPVHYTAADAAAFDEAVRDAHERDGAETAIRKVSRRWSAWYATNFAWVCIKLAIVMWARFIGTPAWQLPPGKVARVLHRVRRHRRDAEYRLVATMNSLWNN